MPLKVVPVLDLKNGLAVHAVGGERGQYRPLVSVLHPTPDPLGLALALHERLGFRQLYLADLDAIAGAGPNRRIYRGLVELGLDCWVDAGVSDVSSVLPLIEANVSTIIVGLETVGGPEALRAIVALVGPSRLVFSLDLRHGIPLTADRANWSQAGAEAIAHEVIGLGVRRLLLLDLARVGRGQGIGTEPLLRRLALTWPEVEITVGGGISKTAEMQPLAEAGASAVLVGSALHDGRIGRQELARIRDLRASSEAEASPTQVD